MSQNQFHTLKLAQSALGSGRTARNQLRTNRRNVAYSRTNAGHTAANFIKKFSTQRMALETSIKRDLAGGMVSNAISLDKIRQNAGLHLALEADWRKRNPNGTSISITSQGVASKVKPPKTTGGPNYDDNAIKEED